MRIHVVLACSMVLVACRGASDSSEAASRAVPPDVGASTANSGAPVAPAAKPPPGTHPSCALTGQTPRALQPPTSLVEVPGGAGTLLGPGLRTIEGYLLKTSPIVIDMGERQDTYRTRGYLADGFAGSEVGTFEFGAWVRAEQVYENRTHHEPKTVFKSVTATEGPPTKPRTLLSYTGHDHASFQIMHDGTARYGDAVLELRAEDVDKILGALGEANVDELPSRAASFGRNSPKLWLSCRRLQAIELGDVPEAVSVLDEVRDAALGSTVYEVAYDYRFKRIKPWPKSLPPLGEPWDRDQENTKVPEALARQIEDNGRRHPENPVLFRSGGLYYKVKVRGSARRPESFGDVSAIECSPEGGNCTLAPDELRFSKNSRLSRLQVAQMGVEPRRSLIDLRDRWVVEPMSGTVYGGVILLGETTLDPSKTYTLSVREVFTSVRWPRSAPSPGTLRMRGDEAMSQAVKDALPGTGPFHVIDRDGRRFTVFVRGKTYHRDLQVMPYEAVPWPDDAPELPKPGETLPLTLDDVRAHWRVLYRYHNNTRPLVVGDQLYAGVKFKVESRPE